MKTTACVFPGQGSQSKGMLADMAEAFPVVGSTFERCSEALGYDLWDIVQNDPEHTLNQTEVTQPALLASSVALWEVFYASNTPPAYLAGHSLGEYSALVCADVLSLEDGVQLVRNRGRYMQQAVADTEGAMYAIIGLEDAVIEETCAEHASSSGRVVQPVNFNSPGQVVIAGHADAVEAAATRCKELGAKRALQLPVSVPSHCDLMKPAAQALEHDLLQLELKAPKIPVIHNVDVASHSSADEIRAALVSQLYKPVQWTKTIADLSDKGIEAVYEVGPGKVLTGLNKRINRSLVCAAANTPDTIII